jgi:hypothetical protein
MGAEAKHTSIAPSVANSPQAALPLYVSLRTVIACRLITPQTSYPHGRYIHGEWILKPGRLGMTGRVVEGRGAARLARNIRVGRLLEDFIVAGVAAILVIRFFLALTGFPQLGGKGLHIAHMLWGGLLMLVSLVLLVALLGRWIQQIAAILGGIGFGTFIDELGKFITSDNNYFFQPTIALIYMIFVLLFLSAREIVARAAFSQREIVANALDQVKEVVLQNGAPSTAANAAIDAELVRQLRASGSSEPLVVALTDALQRVENAPVRPPSQLERLAARISAGYWRLIGSRQFATLVILGCVAYALITAVFLVLALRAPPPHPLAVRRLTFVEVCLTLTAAVSAALILIGVLVFPRSRLHAYRWFRRAILVAILLEQVFLFYILQLAAMVGLVVNLAVLATLNYLIHEELRRGGHQTNRTVTGESGRVATP